MSLRYEHFSQQLISSSRRELIVTVPVSSTRLDRFILLPRTVKINKVFPLLSSLTVKWLRWHVRVRGTLMGQERYSYEQCQRLIRLFLINFIYVWSCLMLCEVNEEGSNMKWTTHAWTYYRRSLMNRHLKREIVCHTNCMKSEQGSEFASDRLSR